MDHKTPFWEYKKQNKAKATKLTQQEFEEQYNAKDSDFSASFYGPLYDEENQIEIDADFDGYFYCYQTHEPLWK